MQPSIIHAGLHTDERGTLTTYNDLDLSQIKRMYFVEHPDTEVVRAWQAHRYEQKWLMVLQGSFTVALVEPDNWEDPSTSLKPEVFHLKAEENRVLHVPAGYANGFKAEVPGSKMMILSNFSLEESLNDIYRFDKKMWYNW